MAQIFKEKFGISIIEGEFDNTMEVFMTNGINFLEVRLVNGNDLDLMREYIDSALSEKKRLGYEIPTVHLPQLSDHDFSSLNEEIRLAAVEKQKRLVEMSMCLSPQIIVIHPDTGMTEEKDWHLRHASLVKSLKDFAPWCKERGLKVAIENLTQISAFQTSEILCKVIEEVGEDNVGICFDVNHLFLETHRDFINHAGEYIITMHVSDNDGLVEKHYFPGDGVIDWGEIFALMDSLGYDGPMICECGYIVKKGNFPELTRQLTKKWQSLHNQ